MSSDIILDVRKLEKNYNTTTHEGKETIAKDIAYGPSNLELNEDEK